MCNMEFNIIEILKRKKISENTKINAVLNETKALFYDFLISEFSHLTENSNLQCHIKNKYFVNSKLHIIMNIQKTQVL